MFLVIAATTAGTIAVIRTAPKYAVIAPATGMVTAGIVNSAEAIAATATATIMRRPSSSCSSANQRVPQTIVSPASNGGVFHAYLSAARIIATPTAISAPHIRRASIGIVMLTSCNEAGQPLHRSMVPQT
jgi:hypothetical protein